MSKCPFLFYILNVCLWHIVFSLDHGPHCHGLFVQMFVHIFCFGHWGHGICCLVYSVFFLSTYYTCQHIAILIELNIWVVLHSSPPLFFFSFGGRGYLLHIHVLLYTSFLGSISSRILVFLYSHTIILQFLVFHSRIHFIHFPDYYHLFLFNTSFSLPCLSLFYSLFFISVHYHIHALHMVMFLFLLFCTRVLFHFHFYFVLSQY